MKRTIRLYGSLAEQFTSEPIVLDVDDPRLMVSALDSMFRGKFRKALRQHDEFYLMKQREDSTYSDVTSETWTFPLGDRYPNLHIAAAPQGSGYEVAAYILGSAAVGTAAYYAIAIAVNLVIGFAISAVVEMISPKPKNTERNTESPANNPSYIFNGAVNVSEPGYPVPVVYGEFRVGSVVVSTGTVTMDIPQ